MTGVFNLRPLKPRLSFVWDVDILLWYFEEQGDNNSLSDKLLTQKLLTLCYCLMFIELVLSNYLVCLIWSEAAIQTCSREKVF